MYEYREIGIHVAKCLQCGEISSIYDFHNEEKDPDIKLNELICPKCLFEGEYEEFDHWTEEDY